MRGKTTELLLRDFGEVNYKRTYNLELSKLKNRTEQNCQRTNEENNQKTLQKKDKNNLTCNQRLDSLASK